MNCFTKLDFRIWQFAFCLSFIYLLVGCSNNANKNRAPETKGTVRLIEQEFLWPTRPTFISEYRMLYIDEKEPCFLHLYDPINKKKVFSGYQIGRGPDEMLGPFSISIESDTAFWIHDIVQKEFKQFLIIGDSIASSKKIPLQEKRLLYPNILNNDFVLAVNISSESDAWVNIYDSVGNLIRELVKYPENELGIPQSVFMESYQGNLKVKPDKSKFVLACRYSDMLNVYNIDGTPVLTYRTNKPFKPKMIVQSIGGGIVMAQNDETILGFTDVAVSDDYIFGLFSGKSRKEKDPSYCNEILQFDWSGKLLMRYFFEVPLVSITFSNEEQALYMFIMESNIKKLANFRITND